ncbi:MAG TPA: hypothetical protein VH253_08850 [Phycisphaerae bacterium]|nr:hypothetical protein [Phycisphaerae bacterium]
MLGGPAATVLWLSRISQPAVTSRAKKMARVMLRRAKARASRVGMRPRISWARRMG